MALVEICTLRVPCLVEYVSPFRYKQYENNHRKLNLECDFKKTNLNICTQNQSVTQDVEGN